MTSDRGPDHRPEANVILQGSTISGFVYDPTDPSRHFVVELLLDGWPYAVARADHHNMANAADGDGHRFVFSLPRPCNASTAVVRLANLNTPIDDPIDLTKPFDAVPVQRFRGEVKWEGGLRLSGWIGPRESPRRIRGLVNEDLVFDIAPSGWSVLHHDHHVESVPRFDVHLPLSFADGTIHVVDVIDDDGQPLAGSPVTLMAFDDGLERFLIGREANGHWPRGKLFDALFPQSMPFGWLGAWLDRFPLRDEAMPAGSVAVVLFGDENVDESLAALHRCGCRWLLGVLPLDPRDFSLDPGDLTAFLNDEAKDAETVVFAFSGAQLGPPTLASFHQALTAGDADLAYGDVILFEPNGAQVPLPLPDFDLERLLEQGYAANLFALKRATALAAARSVTSPHELLSFAVDQDPSKSPVHLTGFLAKCPLQNAASQTASVAHAARRHFARRGAQATVSPNRATYMPAVHVKRSVAADSIAVLVPLRHRSLDSRASIESIRALRTRHRIDVHAIDFGAADEATLRLLTSLRGQHEHVFQVRPTTSVARALNEAARDVRSRFLFVLDDGATVGDGDWFDELVARCAPIDVAGSGPLLVSPDGAVLCAGLVLGVHFGVGAIGEGDRADDPGDNDLLRIARSCSALPLPGLLVKRADFAAVGGFDADRFGHCFHSVDLCLRMSARRKRFVFTPHAQLRLSNAGTSLANLFDPKRHPQTERELERLQARWGQALLGDPYYNSSLCLNRRAFSALAWPPRPTSLHRGAL